MSRDRREGRGGKIPLASSGEKVSACGDFAAFRVVQWQERREWEAVYSLHYSTHIISENACELS